MIFGLVPATELGVLWLQATVSVALVWLFVRTGLMPVVVATATVYTVTILAWMALVHWDIPTFWELQVEGRGYPVVVLGGLDLLTAFLVLWQMRIRRRRRKASTAPSTPDAKAPAKSQEPIDQDEPVVA